MSGFTKELLKEFKIQKFWKVLLSSLLGIIFTAIISPVILDKLLKEAEKNEDKKLKLVCDYLKHIAYIFAALFIAMLISHIYLVRTRVRLCWTKISERQLQRQLLTTQEQKQQLESLLVVPNESQIERLQASRPQTRLSSGSGKPSPSGSPIILPPPSTTAQTEKSQVTRARSRFSSGSGNYSPSGSPIAQPPTPSTTVETERLQVTRAQSRFSNRSGSYSSSGSPIAQPQSPSTTAQTGRKGTRAQSRLSSGSGNYSPNCSPIVQLQSPSTTDSPTHLVRLQTYE